MPRGEKNKLSMKDRKEIYALKGTISGYKVAEKYKVSHTMIYKIWGRKPPADLEEALRQIGRELETTRGFTMDDRVFKMWCNIHNIVIEALHLP